MTVARRANEELMIIATPWYKKLLALLTMYGELSAARFTQEFAPVHARLQKEWIFVAGFVSRFTIAFCCRFPINSSFDVKLVALSSYVFSLFFFCR